MIERTIDAVVPARRIRPAPGRMRRGPLQDSRGTNMGPGSRSPRLCRGLFGRSDSQWRSARQGLKLLLAGLTLVATSAHLAAQTVDNFYRGKTISMIIGYGVGGGYDL